MPKTLEEYHRYWQKQVEEQGFPGTEWITPTSCVLSGSMLASAPGMSDAFYVFEDFGDAVGFCRYFALDKEVGNSLRAKTSQAEVAAYQKEAEQYFDALLERFVRDGYLPGMDKELRDGIGEYFRIYQLDSIFVLPNDLIALLDYTGNPFKSYRGSDEDDGEEEDEEDQSYIAEFDLDNPDHCAALWQRLYEMIL